jgi:hypothetical protein
LADETAQQLVPPDLAISVVWVLAKSSRSSSSSLNLFTFFRSDYDWEQSLVEGYIA